MGRTRRLGLVLAAVLATSLTLAAPASAHDEPGEDPPPPREIAGEPVLSATCEDSNLPPHTGFQIAPACVPTEFGEVTEAAKNPQLLIVQAPGNVLVGQTIQLKVSTRNLIRDRFLPAGQGGYYLERAHLKDGLTRGHFHSACRLIGDGKAAPAPDRNASFVATEDSGGGAAPDTVTVMLPGLPAAGLAQCAVWAGDGSHRMPLMQFANQVPAFDAVRLNVRGR